MSTIVDAPSMTEAVKLNIAKWLLQRKRTKEESTRTQLDVWQRLMRLVWHVAGFTLLTVAGFYAHMIAGFVVAGISCFLMSRLTTVPTNQESPVNTVRPLRR